jgi:hypothetical protein
MLFSFFTSVWALQFLYNTALLAKSKEIFGSAGLLIKAALWNSVVRTPSSVKSQRLALKLLFWLKS